MTDNTVPPEPDSPFARDVPAADEWDGYWTREHTITEAMVRMGLSKSDAEAFVDRHGPAAIELVRGSR